MRFNGAASMVFLEFLASSGVFGSLRGAQWLLASTWCEFLVSCAVFLFSARSPMVAGPWASTGCEFLFSQAKCFSNNQSRFILRNPFCAHVSAPRLLVGYKNTSLVIPSMIWICLSYTLSRIKPTNHGGRQVKNCSHMDGKRQHQECTYCLP